MKLGFFVNCQAEVVGLMRDVKNAKENIMPTMASRVPTPGQPMDFRLVIDSTPALIHTGLPDGYLDFFNQTWLKYVGRSLEDLQGWKWTASIHPDDVDGIVDRWRASLASGEPFLYEARVRRADGEYRWMLHHKIALRDKDGKVVKWYGSSIDIEDRKQTEQTLRLTESFLLHAQRLTKAGSWAYRPPDICEYWSAEMFRIFGYDPAKGYPPNDDMIARVHPEDRQRGAQGVAQLFEQHREFDQKYRFIRPDGQVRVIQDFGTPIFENGIVTRFVGACLDVTEQEQMTQELKRREAYLAEAQRLSHTGSFGWMVSTSEIFWSKETFRIFSYDPALKPTLDLVFERIHPEDVPLVKETIELASQDGKNFHLEHRLLMPDASVKHVHVVAQALRNDSGNIEFVGAVMDITAAKQAEERILQNERELRLTIETIPAFVGTALPNGSVDFVSQSWLDYTGLSREEWLGWGWMKVTHPEDLDRSVENWRAALAVGQPIESELRVRQASGEYRWFLGRNVPLRDEKGNIVKWYGTLVDIEDRKRTELKLRQDEQEFRRIVDAIPHAIHVLKPDGSFLYANQAVLDYTGFTMEEVMAPDYRTRVFHPEDLEKIREERQKALSRGLPFEQEQRGRRRDGQYRWFLIHYNPLRDEQDRIIRWYATGIDIEDRKRAEERMRNENLALREEIDRSSMFEEIVGTSPALQAVLSRVFKVAPVDSTVLITGDTGTGKELVARAIHRRSQRSSHAFVSVNCAAIPRDLIASELFGHEKGSFTGALQRRLGRFELAEGGTLFLDEVGELPLETQIALLRVLQEREFERVGGSQSIRADVRVIAATNRDLETAISSGAFRRDLYYRLNVFPIEIPTLAERKEDIPVLVEYFIDRYARKAGKKIRIIEKNTLELLQSYSWPGNIRELQNVIERSVIVCDTETFSVDQSWLSIESSRARSASQPLARMSAVQEKQKIEAALAESAGKAPALREQRQSWAYPLPPWSQRFGRSKSTSFDSNCADFPILFTQQFACHFAKKPQIREFREGSTLLTPILSISYNRQPDCCQRDKICF
jgi:PAS domain S-box-containing protein